MVNVKEVVWIRMPFPNISSTLAKQRHMYICMKHSADDYRFVKVQTDKPSVRQTISEYVAENADPSRNPFRNPSLIDCDKLFEIKDCWISEEAYPESGRKDVCDDIFESVTAKTERKPIHDIDVDKIHSVDDRVERASSYNSNNQDNSK